MYTLMTRKYVLAHVTLLGGVDFATVAFFFFVAFFATGGGRVNDLSSSSLLFCELRT